jgi:nucleotide-binding universal stress UspA family protein
MSMIVGYAPDERGKAALHLASMFARSSGHDLSAPAGLLQLAEEHEANLIVLGSSSAGLFGHVALGSVTDRLVHSSPVSIALATRGFRCRPGSKVVRVTNEALAQVEELSEAPRKVETAIGHGETRAEAVDEIGWEQGDVLVVGSSGIGPVAQVFLGFRATKILRHSPVPVVVVPRGRAEELAHA